MSKETEDLKEEEKTSPGTGQPEKKPAEDSKGDEPGDEKVEISKSELEKIKSDRDNYREGVLASKRKGRTIPGSEPAKKEEEKEELDEYGEPIKKEKTEEFVTKKDFQKQIERSAIKEASKDPEVDENWDSIMEFYNARHGKDTVEDLLTDIEVAHKTWKAQQIIPKEPEKEDEDKKSTSELAQDAGLGSGKDKNPKPEKKSILPKKEPMKEWYGK